MRSILLSAVVLVVIAGLVASNARASALAFDSAADPAYAPYLYPGNLPSGINGGYGWGSGWISLGGPPSNDLNVSSTAGFAFTNPFTAPGYSWWLTYWSGIPAGNLGVERLFNGGLEPGQTFSFDYFSLFGQSIFLTDSSGTGIYEIDTGVSGGNCLFTFEGQPYTRVELALPFTDVGGHFSITPVDANDAILSATSYGPGGGTNSIEMPYSTIGGVFFQAGREEFVDVNNLSITPEPQASALIAAAGLGLLLRRSRRSRALNTPGIAL